MSSIRSENVHIIFNKYQKGCFLPHRESNPSAKISNPDQEEIQNSNHLPSFIQLDDMAMCLNLVSLDRKILQMKI